MRQQAIFLLMYVYKNEKTLQKFKKRIKYPQSE